MKKILFLIIILIATSGLYSFDEDYLNKVSFINNTGGDIWYLFLSPGDSEYWGFDILGSERTIEDNNLLSFYILYPDSENYFDIMAIDEDGNSFILYDQLISDDEQCNVIISEGDLDDGVQDFGFVQVDFENQTDYEMLYIFVSPSDSAMWGVDMMDDEQTLLSWETLSILAPYSDEITSFDVMTVDEDLDEYQFSLEIDPVYIDPIEDVLEIPIEVSDLMD